MPFAHHGEAERWLPVVGYEGLYDISDLGRVRSLPRNTTRGGILRQWITTTGYPAVTLCRDGVRENWAVHRLVGEAFIGPLPPGLETRHGGNGALDPSLSNISYGTSKENNGPDKVRDGTINRGEDRWNAKLTAADVAEIRARWANGESGSTLGPEFGINRNYVSDLARGIRWGLPPVVRTTDGYSRGEAQHNSKLTEAIVAECRRRRNATGESYCSMAREFGVTKAVMREAVLGITWRHVE